MKSIESLSLQNTRQFALKTRNCLNVYLDIRGLQVETVCLTKEAAILKAKSKGILIGDSYDVI